MTTPRYSQPACSPELPQFFHLISFLLSASFSQGKQTLVASKKGLAGSHPFGSYPVECGGRSQRGSSSSSASVLTILSPPTSPSPSSTQGHFKVPSILLGRVLRLPGAINITHITPFISLPSWNCLSSLPTLLALFLTL